MAAEEQTSGGQKQQQQHLPMEGEDITPQKDRGVLKLVKREGSGAETPAPGDKVWVHYVGTLLDGTPFDSSRERGDEKFQFALGQRSVIKAWELGVATMKVGELCRLVCKPEYAYGSQGSPPKIPPNATLVFEVELFAFRAEDVTEAEDGGVTRRVLAKGQGYDKPNVGAAVEVAVEGSHEGRVFDRREGLKFELGDGESLGLPVGVETAIAAMEQGEESLFTVAPAYGFGSAGSAEHGIPGGAELKYKIRLAAFDKAKEEWDMSTTEKLEQSAVVKEKGTQRFREGKYQQAATQYKRVVQWLEPERGFSEEEAPRARELRLAARLNLAACCLKAREPAAALEHCDHALTLDEASEKALFRRGEALLALKEYERARADFQKVARLYPANRAAKSQAGLCHERLRAQREKERLLYGRMFHTPSEVEATKPAAGKSEVEEGKKKEEKEVVGMEVENAGDVQELEKKAVSVEAEEKTA